MKRMILGFLTLFVISSCSAQHIKGAAYPALEGEKTAVIPAAARTDVYIPLLKGKSVAVFANQTSVVGDKHIVDILQENGIAIKAIFSPEHGFRGTADAGEKVGDYTDKESGLHVISLYGKKNKPSQEDLKGVDIMIFDIQDVGVRFYTYITSLQRYMETAFENKIPLLILDRPNPNGFYVDGPVLDPKYASSVGMQPIPVVYGMTIGEYARMIAGERWLSEKANLQHDYYDYAKNSADTGFHFLVIKCENYSHNSHFELPVKPSPNLPEIQSIYIYPSTCYFEGTVFSEGRGTAKPFQIFGDPRLPKTMYAFTPEPNEGAKNSKHYGETCYGWNLSGPTDKLLNELDNRIQLKWFLEAYKLFPEKDKFFILPKSGKIEDAFITKLTGTPEFAKQVMRGDSEEEIRASWEPALSEFKAIRKKYLMYADFDQ